MSFQFVTKLSEKEVEQLQADFLKADVNHDGGLDEEEFKKLMSCHVHVADQASTLFKLFDVDGDGKIQTKEFLSAMAIATKGTKQEKLESLFKLYDIDGNKILTPNEIERLLNHLKLAAAQVLGGLAEEDVSEGFAKNIINKLDKNHDGNISLEEWVSVGEKTPSLLNLLGVTL